MLPKATQRRCESVIGTSLSSAPPASVSAGFWPRAIMQPACVQFAESKPRNAKGFKAKGFEGHAGGDMLLIERRVLPMIGV